LIYREGAKSAKEVAVDVNVNGRTFVRLDEGDRMSLADAGYERVQLQFTARDHTDAVFVACSRDQAVAFAKKILEEVERATA
jgi:hypothetical protein